MHSKRGEQVDQFRFVCYTSSNLYFTPNVPKIVSPTKCQNLCAVDCNQGRIGGGGGARGAMPPCPVKISHKQECIPVGCVLPAHWLYLCMSSYPMHAPLSPCMPPFTMYAPWQPCTPPTSNHACLPATMHVPLPATMHPPPATMHAPQQPHMPISNHTHFPHQQPHMPYQQPCMPPQQPHTPPSNHAHPLPATTHAPWQPCTPPSNHTCPLATMHTPSPCGQTDTCKNITFANFVCGQ